MSHRSDAEALIRFACLSRDPGRPFTDPVYKAVTEVRQDRTAEAIRRWEATPTELRKGGRPFYSSCGDLAHWLLFRLGVRFSWINRDEHDGWNYRGADNNVTTLCYAPLGANRIARKVRTDDRFFAGDILIVNAALRSAHVSCVIEHVPEIGYLLTGDYGQPHGALRDGKDVRIENGRMIRGERTVDSVLLLDDVILAAQQAEMLQETETAEEYAKRFPSVQVRA